MRRFLLLGGVLASLSGVAAERISLEEAIQRALRANVDIAVARLEVQRADARVREAVGTALPSIGISANYVRNLQLPVFFLPDFRNPGSGQLSPVRIGSENSFQVQLQATQVLFSQAVLTGIGAAQIYAQAARSQYRAVVARTVTEVRKAFYAALLARERVEAVRASLARAERLAQDTRVLASQGLVADYDALRAQVQLEQLRAALAQAEMAYTAARSQLALLMGRTQQEPFEPDGTLEAEYRAEPIPTEEGLWQQALERNFELQTLRLQQQVQQAIARIYRAESYPLLLGFGNYVYQGQSPTFSNFLTARSAAVGVQLQLSLFQGLQTNARVEQATVEAQKVQQQESKLQEALKLQLRLLRESLRVAQEQIAAGRSTVQAAERGYEIARTRYAAGLGALLELFDADAALRQANTTYLQALYDWLAARADLEYLTGSVDQRYFERL
jgi:outer membrane protein TolC